jgi:plasmid stabilization system protein ParE
MRLRFHPDARAELDEDALWYEDDYPGRGGRFREAVMRALDRTVASPRSFPFWRRRSDVRACVVDRFPYTLFFIAEPAGVTVYAVAHHKRRPGYWRKRLPPG